jgi:hypothetical protein
VSESVITPCLNRSSPSCPPRGRRAHVASQRFTDVTRKATEPCATVPRGRVSRNVYSMTVVQQPELMRSVASPDVVILSPRECPHQWWANVATVARRGAGSCAAAGRVPTAIPTSTRAANKTRENDESSTASRALCRDYAARGCFANPSAKACLWLSTSFPSPAPQPAKPGRRVLEKALFPAPLQVGGTGLEPVTPSLSSWCSPN